MVAAAEQLAAHCGTSLLFTFAPSTPPLAVMHAVGRLFPRGDRAPAIEPQREVELRRRLGRAAGLCGWIVERHQRIASGFYTSHAVELTRGSLTGGNWKREAVTHP
jgi:magnesium-protoporphyrin O-methyltransferase